MKSICIVGLGSIGRRHCKVFQSLGFEDILGVDLRPERIEQAKTEAGLSQK